MKRFIAILLLLCLAAACVPASANGRPARRRSVSMNALNDPAARGSSAGQFIIDLSTGEAKIADPAAAGLVADTLQAAYDQGLVWDDSTPEDYARYDWLAPNGGEIVLDDLDKDGIPDLIEVFADRECTQLIRIVVADTFYSPTAVMALSPDPSRTAYPVYSPLVLVFRSAVSDAVGNYKLTEDGAEFVKPLKKNLTTIKVPATVTVDGVAFQVTKIGKSAFKGQKNLTKVTLGKYVREIGAKAFASCAKLKAFTIGAKVARIGTKAFYKCAALKKITIKSRLLTAGTVGAHAFKGIKSNATIKVPAAVKEAYAQWLPKKGVKPTMKIK